MLSVMKNKPKKEKVNKMKKITISIIMGTIIIGSALNAQSIYGTSTNYGGNTTYHSFSNGLNGTSSNYGGNTTYHNLNSGLYGTSSNYGGNTTYHNLSNGVYGTSTCYPCK